ncbi:MAG: L-2-amino-thiazoline-4-carboxylic acid hydrolase [Oscillospiraceae bacterium]|nr:L-2-amino-thiazoline-4-carboxylic acid hydrolase [Oscillospiraceae bacterium]
MREESLPINRKKHRVYSDNARRMVRRLLVQYAPKEKVGELWRSVQLRYCQLTKDAPPFGKIPHNEQFYDALMVFAYLDTVPYVPPREVMQQAVYETFMSAFDVLGAKIDANKIRYNALMAGIFKLSVKAKAKQHDACPEWFDPTECTFDAGTGAVMYAFRRCPVADFALSHGFGKYLPYMCNCDHLALQRLHAGLIRTSTCGVGDICDYTIVGDRSSLYAQYRTVTNEDGLLLSVRRDDADDIPVKYGSLL